MDYLNIKDNQYCFICNIQLGMKSLKRFHHCHRCEVLVCGTCSNNKIILYHSDEKYQSEASKPQRVCIICYKDYQYYKAQIEKFNIKWNHPSKLQHQWSCNIGINHKHKSNQSYKYYLQKAKESKLFLTDFEAVLKDVEHGRTDGNTFNFSVREFIALVQLGVDNKKARTSIQNLLYAAIIYNPQLGYCQGMNYIAGFLLCFCDEEGAFLLLTHLFDYILPDKFYQGGSKGNALIGFQAEQHFIKQIIQAKFTENCVESAIKFVDYYSAQFLLTILVNPMMASTLIVAWSEMFTTNSFIGIDQVFLFCLEKNQQFIQANENCPGLNSTISKMLQAEELNIAFENRKTEYFSKFERSVYLAQYFTNQSQLWVSDNRSIIYKLRKITNFNETEIVQIQSEYKKFCQNQKVIPTRERCLAKQYSRDEQSDEDEYDEAEEEEARIAQLKNLSQFKQGVQIEAFVQLMEKFHAMYEESTKLNEFNENEYKTIFDIFDDEGSGSLDFREFLICFSVLLRGSLEQKLSLLFSSFGNKKGKYLTKFEFDILLSRLLESIARMNNDEWVIAQKSLFLDRVNTQHKTLQYLNYTDVMALTLDPFIIAMTDKNQQSDIGGGRKPGRQNTCDIMQQTFQTLNNQNCSSNDEDSS